MLRKPATFGLIGALLCYFAMGTVHVQMMPRYLGMDEVRHVAYALALMDGEWPKMTDTMDLKRLHTPKRRDSNLMAAANHPPLYYWLIGPPLKVGYDAGQHDLAVRIARYLTLLMGGGALVYMWRIASAFFPRQPAIPVVTTMLIAILPAYINTCALAYNDALHVLTTTAFFDAAVRMYLHGPTRGRIAAVGVWMSLAMLTRFPAVLVFGPALSLCFLGVVRHTEGPLPRRIGLGTALAGGLTLLVAATSGWFYYRNYQLYGDITGAGTALAGFHRKTRGSLPSVLLDFKAWGGLIGNYWIRFAGLVFLGGVPEYVLHSLNVVSLVCALEVGFRAMSQRGTALLRDERFVAGLHAVAAAAIILLAMFYFYSKGGLLNQRYFFAMIWLPALVGSAGYALTKFRELPMAMIGLWSLLALYVLERYAERIVKSDAGFGVARALAAQGVPFATGFAILAAVVFGGGLALVLTAVSRLHVPLLPAKPPES